MAFLHCHDCDWQQDDFWSLNGYNPVGHLKEYLPDLFKAEVTLCPENGTGEEIITGQEYVARELERAAASIRGMYVRTSEDFQEIKDEFKCPKCGSSNWDVD